MCAPEILELLLVSNRFHMCIFSPIEKITQRPTARPTPPRPSISLVVENESFRQERGVNTFVTKAVDNQFEPFKPSLRDSLFLDNLV